MENEKGKRLNFMDIEEFSAYTSPIVHRFYYQVIYYILLQQRTWGDV